MILLVIKRNQRKQQVGCNRWRAGEIIVNRLETGKRGLSSTPEIVQ